MKPFYCCILSVVFILIVGCSRKDGLDTYEITASTPLPNTESQDSSIVPTPSNEQYYHADSGNDNSEAFQLGYNHTAQILDRNPSTAQLRDDLLELQSRVYHIACNAGRETADSYVHGVEECMKERSDTLYRELFAKK